ncbi:MAG: S8 family serine peptidase [Myxococcales bacterium]|nr:S8 family serine peptidase [Myxococcales bacterium]
MKAHLKLGLREGVPEIAAPHWTKATQMSAGLPASLHPRIDAVFAEHRCPFLVTREYEPAGTRWDAHERELGFDRAYRVIPRERPDFPAGLLEALARLWEVASVTHGVFAAAALPVPAMQLSVGTDERSREAIGLSQAHALTRGSPEIKVAVLDTGIDLDHPELVDCLLPGYDFVDIIDGAGRFVGDFLGYDEEPDDEVGHGTHVAGIIAAAGKAMPAGVAPRCKIIPVRVLGALARGARRVGAGLVDNINAGIKWAIDHGADVINMSLGIPHAGGGLPHEEMVEYARRRDVTNVAASGNDGAHSLYYPGALPHVIAVGAVDHQGQVASFSTYGEQVDVAAPGTEIYSTSIEGGYAYSTGTSHAAPFVAGAAALLKAYALDVADVRLSDRQIKYLLKHTADRPARRLRDDKTGFGRLNLADALQLLEFKLEPRALATKTVMGTP